MTKRLFVFTLVILFSVMFSELANASETPPLFPSIYSGNVIDQAGQPVASGTIKAYIDNELKGDVDFQGGKYEGLVVNGDADDTNKPVSFKIEIGGKEYAAVSDPAQVLWESEKVSGDNFTNINLKADLSKAVTPPAGGNSGNGTVSTEQPVTEDEESDVQKVIKLTIGQLSATVDDNPYTLDAEPYVTESSRTMVPLRFVSEALGAEVEWISENRQVEIVDGDAMIVLPIGATSVTVNGDSKTIEAPATIMNNRTFVPLRYVSETLGAQVDYDAETKGITITR